MTNAIINSLITIILATNVAYASALSYKESCTDGGNKKTSNGIFAAYFFAFTMLGRVFNGILQSISKPRKSRKEEHRADNLTGVFSAMITFMVAFIANAVFNTLSGSGDDLSLIKKIMLAVPNTFLQAGYFGFIFGFFGGDNCRIQDTFIGAIMSGIKDKLDKYDKANFIESVGDVIEHAEYEYKDAKQGKKSKLNIKSYIISIIVKTVTTITEDVRGLTSLLIELKNPITFVLSAVVFLGARSFIYLQNFMSNRALEESESNMAEIINSPVDILLDQIKSFLVTMLIIAVIKLIIKLIMLVLPKSVSDAYYSFNNKLHDATMGKLNNYSKTSYETDTYAQAYSFKARMHNAEANRK